MTIPTNLEAAKRAYSTDVVTSMTVGTADLDEEAITKQLVDIDDMATSAS